MKRSKTHLIRIMILPLLLAAACSGGHGPGPTAAATASGAAGPTNTAVVEPTDAATIAAPTATPTPAPVPPTSTAVPTIPAVLNELPGSDLPPGFSIIRFASLYRPTAFAFDAGGRLLATSADSQVYLLNDSDGDGRADSQAVFASGFFTPLGITVDSRNGDIFVSYQGAVARLRDTNGDGAVDEQTDVFTGLPFGRHQNDNLRFGPDGWLYMGVGSTCDACFETDPRSGTIMRFNVDTLQSEVYATGLRNPFGVAFSPETGDLFATDNGRDDLGMDAPHEELNRIIADGNYGWPGCWDLHDQRGCQNMIAPVAFFESHSSADSLDFYSSGPFPDDYDGSAFVSIFGSWLKPDVRTGVMRVVLTPSGDSYSSETSWFVKFPAGVMPLALLVGPDGALYVGDYINDAIYRISYGIP